MVISSSSRSRDDLASIPGGQLQACLFRLAIIRLESETAFINGFKIVFKQNENGFFAIVGFICTSKLRVSSLYLLSLAVTALSAAFLAYMDVPPLVALANSVSIGNVLGHALPP